ncbi:hypothetical protein MPSEU_000806800 [Mayamaea pseudoterrestris]|nr:hypothetical protein MPSEU_000806800 [Mayamaea pseudoterrestris]
MVRNYAIHDYTSRPAVNLIQDEMRMRQQLPPPLRKSVRGVSKQFPSLLHIFAILLSLISVFSKVQAHETHYSNFTLESLEGDLSVVVYLPDGLKPDEDTYYYSSRFDHGSMIGSIRYKGHVLFDARTWKQPHNVNWPESGIGLAAEFGVGDDGAFCYFQCGWKASEGVTNGVLGYQQAKLGESFLKIGVGELIKGTCPICDSAEDYRFNSPYLFASPPEWKITGMAETQLKLEHQALMTDKDHVQYGYKLDKEITLRGNTLEVTSTLTNLGQQPLSTAWYSHNFFTCDGTAVGPGYEASLYLQGTQGLPLYEEPATWSWSTPIKQYAQIKERLGSIYLNLLRDVDPGIRIKSEFMDDGQTKGGFLIRACDTQITSSLHMHNDDIREQMYAYGLYVERGTFSPEPMILIHLEPGEAKSWTQRLLIEKNDYSDIRGSSEKFSDENGRQVSYSMNLWQMIRGQETVGLISSTESTLPQFACGGIALVLSAYAVMYLIRGVACRPRFRYTPIPDAELGSQ